MRLLLLAILVALLMVDAELTFLADADFSISLRATHALEASPVSPVIGFGVWVPVRIFAYLWIFSSWRFAKGEPIGVYTRRPAAWSWNQVIPVQYRGMKKPTFLGVNP